LSRVFYDVTCLLPEKLSGVGVYAYQLYKGLKNQGVDLVPVYKASRVVKRNFVTQHIHDKPRPFLDVPNPFSGKGDVVHGPDFKLLTDKNKYHKVLTVHDLAVYREDLLERQFCREGQRKLKAELRKEPDAVILPTEFILGEFLTRFPKFQKRAHVVYHGCDHLVDASTTNATRTSQKALERPYFLYVGHLEKRKNLSRVITAFELFHQSHSDVDLVLVGKDGYGAKGIHEKISRSPAKQRIKTLGFVGAAFLKSLYQGAVAFVYPSLYEGFGMPIIEAMQLGVPVITANGSSTSEVAGPGAHLVDSKSVEAIYQAYLKVFEDSSYREKVLEAGRARARDFSWLKTSRETLSVYKSVES